jgi:hypothetical protein
MHTGMLWFDNSQSPLDVKIDKAIDYYTQKYGRAPDLCLVHPSMIQNTSLIDLMKVRVRPYRPVLPGHIWIGIEDKE